VSQFEDTVALSVDTVAQPEDSNNYDYETKTTFAV
jgi:hypothetical protein